MIRQRLVAGIVAATALVTLASCGSDKKASTATTPTTAVAAAAASTNPASGVSTRDVSVPDVSVADVSVPDISVPDISVPDISVPDVSVPDISTPAATGRCIQLEKDLPDMSGTTNVNSADVQKAFATLSASVPSSLKDDVAEIKTAMQPFYDAVAAAGGDTTKAMQDPAVLAKAEAAFTDPKFTAATTALQDWFNKGCPK